MLYWSDFLHIYQPPQQDPEILNQVTKESYLKIIKLLNLYPKLKITLNISGSLLEQLDHNGYIKVINDLKQLIKKGKIEIVGSAMYHPILPLLPEKEIKRQIELHNEICLKRFGKAYKPTGFYIPEMAYSKSVAKIVKQMGFKWIILDEINFPGKTIDVNTKYKIKNNGLNVVFRNRKFSKSFPPESIVNSLENIKDKYLITAHDGELYGHWHKNGDKDYKKAYTHKDIKPITISQYLKQLKTTKEISPKKASWESTPEELKNKMPYALWDNPKNKIHQLLWQLRALAIKSVSKNSNDPQYIWSRGHLDRGLASCSWWWAAEKRPDIFSPITWNPTEIEKGLKELINSIRSLQNLNPQTKLEAEKIYISLTKAIWHKHWKKYA
jgi:alpha-amylase/alpha-mannosidase (GH57 family)